MFTSMLDLKHVVKIAWSWPLETLIPAAGRLTALLNRTDRSIERIENVQFFAGDTTRCGEVDLLSPRDIGTR